MGTTAAILGASGFAGGEVARILQSHPGIELIAASADTRRGSRLSDVHSGLGADLVLVSSEEALQVGADIVFSSLPHGASAEILHEVESKVVDLGGDFRLKDPLAFAEWYGSSHPHPEALSGWVYGLTEVNRREISSAQHVANPGCYATAAILALWPLTAGSWLEPPVRIDALSGVSGAGRAGGEGFDYSSANENARPYAVTGHKHIAEMEQSLGIPISFTPHLVPMTRGIIVTCTARPARPVTQQDLLDLLENAYAGEPFIRVLGEKELPETRRLSGTNTAELTVRLDRRTDTVVAICALDNLGKGAAGQAVQNANLMLGYPEEMALGKTGLVP